MQARDRANKRSEGSFWYPSYHAKRVRWQTQFSRNLAQIVSPAGDAGVSFFSRGRRVERERTNMLKTTLAAMCSLIVLDFCFAAEAQARVGWYGSASVSWIDQDATDNSGGTNASFTTGNGGPLVPAGSVLPRGTKYGWNTDFDSGLGASAEIGFRSSGGIRTGIELTHTKADIDRHIGLTVAGADIGALDASVLTGAAALSGDTVAEVLNDGQGDIATTSLFVNAYFDFNRDSLLQPYLGAGFGVAMTKIDYAPSGLEIVDDDATNLAWQIKAGASLAMSEQLDLFVEAAYRGSEAAEVANKVLPGTVEIENRTTLVSIGARLTFGG